MIMKERRVNESHIDEIVELIQGEDILLNLDRHDVENMLMGKEGMLYEACNENGTDNATFLKEFFGELMQKDAVRKCKSLLIGICMCMEVPLMMDDMDIVNDFFASIGNDDMDIKWGMQRRSAEGNMSIMAVCME